MINSFLLLYISIKTMCINSIKIFNGPLLLLKLLLYKPYSLESPVFRFHRLSRLIRVMV